MDNTSRMGRILLHTILFVLVVVFILPFFWILQTAIKRDRDIFVVPPKFVPLTVSAEAYDSWVAEADQAHAARLAAVSESSRAALAAANEQRRVRLAELAALGTTDADALQQADADYTSSLAGIPAADLAVLQSQPTYSFLARYGFPITLENYRRTFVEFPFFLYLRNTMVIVVFSTIGTLISCMVAAYAFGCLRWPDRDRVFFIVLATMLLPYQVTLIPMFLLFRELGWVNTLLPLIVPQFFGVPFFIFLLRQFFITLPRDLFEAARIDGAGEVTILWRIVLPLSKPALLTVTIFAAMFAWNDFLGPLIYLSSESKKTLAVGLQSMVSQFGTEWGLLMAAGSVMIIPVLVLFFFAQRYFIEGITLTGMKG